MACITFRLRYGFRVMTDPNELFPENPDDLKPWHPLMGFGWDAVRRMEAHHFAGIADVKARDALKSEEQA